MLERKYLPSSEQSAAVVYQIIVGSLEHIHVKFCKRIVTAINMLISDPTLAAPEESVSYKPSAKLTLAEERIEEQMNDPAADSDKVIADILRAATMRYDSIKYDDRDKTEHLLDILTNHEKIDGFDIELTQKVIKYITVDYGKITIELVNGKKLPIKGA